MSPSAFDVRKYVQLQSFGPRTVRSRLTGVGIALTAAAAIAMTSAPAAQAAPKQPAPAVPQAELELPTAGAPFPPGPGEFSYLATHAVTKRVSTMDIAKGISGLPVPPDYRPANLALAEQFERATAGALKSPGGCLQIIVDPRARSGSLFNYGFFPVEGKYCS